VEGLCLEVVARTMESEPLLISLRQYQRTYLCERAGAWRLMCSMHVFPSRTHLCGRASACVEVWPLRLSFCLSICASTNRVYQYGRASACECGPCVLASAYPYAPALIGLTSVEGLMSRGRGQDPGV
jgi:hypothetical protein